MKIGMVADGGPQVGLGHVTRCLSLAQAIHHRHKQSPVFVNSDSEVRRWIESHGFSTRNSFKGTWDLLVVDSYRLSMPDLKLLRARSDTMLVLDDIGDVRVPCDWILNGSLRAHTFSYQHSHAKGWLIGPRFHLMKKEYWKPWIRRKRHGPVEHVLVTLGGGEGNQLLLRVLSMAQHILPRSTFHVVLGPLTHSGIHRSNSNVKVYQSLQGMRDLMERCDMAITAGGQTLFEVAFCGLPTLSIPVVENQIPNVAAFESIGAITSPSLPEHRLFSLRFKKQLHRLSHDPALRINMAEAGPRLIDGLGALRVADSIMRVNE